MYSSNPSRSRCLPGQQEEVAQTTEALREARQRARKVIYYDGWWHFDAV